MILKRAGKGGEGKLDCPSVLNSRCQWLDATCNSLRVSGFPGAWVVAHLYEIKVYHWCGYFITWMMRSKRPCREPMDGLEPPTNNGAAAAWMLLLHVQGVKHNTRCQ